ncbi:uncharacterized protein NPIL_501201 [Nephila pilipes]|uniref:Uncharacterized protein n=1 Tax=Nephila pilipes TaxID=299642 RepID=A0A8X6UK87_NEPPI|nr:uncharacterized protein NPIL_501201 [Nephila pilipes]
MSSDEKDASNDNERIQDKDDEPEDFQRLFDLYSKVASSESEGTMSLQGAKMWLEQAKLLDENKGISESDVERTFSATHVTGMDKEEFKMWIDVLAERTNKEGKELINKLAAAGPPSAGNRSELVSPTGKLIKP